MSVYDEDKLFSWPPKEHVVDDQKHTHTHIRNLNDQKNGRKKCIPTLVHSNTYIYYQFHIFEWFPDKRILLLCYMYFGPRPVKFKFVASLSRAQSHIKHNLRLHVRHIFAFKKKKTHVCMCAGVCWLHATHTHTRARVFFIHKHCVFFFFSVRCAMSVMFFQRSRGTPLPYISLMTKITKQQKPIGKN